MSQILNTNKYKTKNKEEDKEEEPNKTKRDLVFNTHNRTAPLPSSTALELLQDLYHKNNLHLVETNYISIYEKITKMLK